MIVAQAPILYDLEVQRCVNIGGHLCPRTQSQYNQ